MKLIKQTKLFFKEGNSDKVYEVDLCEVGTDQYVVNFRYGRRGATLKDGTKTTTPLKQKPAEELFDAMEAEKRKKGYQSEAEMFQPLPEVTIDKTAPSTRESAILQRLKAAAEGQPSAFRTTWKTSRVMWAAGELRLKESVPFIIRLVDRGDEMQRYAALWALGRLGDTVAARTLQVYFSNQKYPEKIRRVAGEGLLRVLQGGELQTHLNLYASRLPEAVRQAVQTEDSETLQAVLRERVLVQTHPDYAYLEDLYALAVAAPFIKRALLAILREVPLRPNYFRHLRHLYKLGELRDDYETLGLLAYRMEKTPGMFRKPVRHYWEEDNWENQSRFIPVLNERVKVKPELRKPDSRLAYSDKTRAYFKRKVFRTLNEMGQTQSLDYVKMAMGLLLAYDKTVDFQQPYSVTEWKYLPGQNGLNWEHRQFQIYFPAYAKAVLLNQILYGRSPRLELINQNVWQVKEPVVVNRSGRNQPETPPTTEQQSSGVLAGLLHRIGNWFAGDAKNEPAPVASQPTEVPDAVVPAREEPYPELWDQMPQAYVQLLLQARVDEIHAFALNNLQNHPEYEAIESRLDLKMLQVLLTSEFQVPAFFGLEVARKRLSQQADVDLILASLNSSLKEARALGREYAARHISLYFRDTELITQLLLSPYEDVRKWMGQMLTNANLSEEQANLVIGRVIAALMGWQENTEAVNRIIGDATQVLLSQYPLAFQALSMSVVGDLLRVPVEATQVFAGKLLVLKQATGQLPAEILIAFILSPFLQVRKVAAELLDSQQTRFQQDPAFATQLANQLVPLLMRKETYEGLHQDVAQLLSNQLVDYLSFVDRTLALQLVYANYRPAQDFGLVLLDKYIQPDDLTIRQVIALGNHEILAFRQWCQTFFEKHLARIRFEREESVRLLDAKWDDTRVFAVTFFRDKFTAEDWTPETLIAIVDTVRPDIQAFGRELIGRFFEEADGAEYLLKLSQHPGVAVQLFATNFLERYASDQPERLYALETFFRSVLTRVNKARVAKDRIYQFLQTEGLKSEENARFVARIVADVSATVAIGDKARCIQLMQALSKQYGDLNLPIQYVAIEERVG